MRSLNLFENWQGSRLSRREVEAFYILSRQAPEMMIRGKYSLNQVYLNGNRTQINTEGTQMNADLKHKELTEKIIEESL